MNKELIDKIAADSGVIGMLSGRYDYDSVGSDHAEFHKFAALVAEEIIRMADSMKPHGGRMWTDGQAACFDCLSGLEAGIRAKFPMP